MSPNPYAPPQARIAERDAAPSALYEIGRNQQILVWMALCSLLSIALPSVLRPLIGGLCAMFAYRLGRQLYPLLGATALALLTLVPLLGLLALLAINVRATRRLRAAGLRVGFMGARVAHLRPAL
jgi:hypothetical protein